MKTKKIVCYNCGGHGFITATYENGQTSANSDGAYGYVDAKQISEAPTVDDVPVVRCRDCKYHYWEQEPCHGKSVHYCKLPHMRGVEVFKEFFCYYGERKEGADNEP